MSFNYIIIYSILIYASIQSLILVLFTLHHKRIALSSFFLSLFIILSHFLYESFDIYKSFPELLWTNTPFWFLLAPTLYLSVKEYLGVKKNRYGIQILHFLPALIFFAISFNYFFLTPGITKLKIYQSFYENKSFDYVQIIYFVQMIFYLVLLRPMITERTREMKSNESDSTIIMIQYIRMIVIGLYAYILISMIISIILHSTENLDPNYYSVQFLMIGLIIVVSNILFMKYQLFQNELPKQGLISAKHTYQSSSLSIDEKQEIIQKLKFAMESDHLYLNSTLRLHDVAEHINVPSHNISQALNQDLAKNFFEFVNSYRIDHVKSALIESDINMYSIEGIALKSGFKNVSSFYRIFKEYVRVTPKQFIENSINSNES